MRRLRTKRFAELQELVALNEAALHAELELRRDQHRAPEGGGIGGQLGQVFRVPLCAHSGRQRGRRRRRRRVVGESDHVVTGGGLGLRGV